MTDKPLFLDIENSTDDYLKLLRQGNKRKKSHRNVKRQPGSLSVWQNETNGLVHEVVHVHNGRVTRKVIGPEAHTLEAAHDFLTAALKEGI